jgi:hypothetical protein
MLVDDRPEFQGYSDLTSVQPGGTITFFLRWGTNSPPPVNYKMTISRFPSGPSSLIPPEDIAPITYQPYVASDTDSNANNTASAKFGCNWPRTAQFRIPGDWPSGLYKASVFSSSHNNNNPLEDEEIFFVVKPARFETKSRIVVLIDFATLQAYNFWGGGSFYGSPSQAEYDKQLRHDVKFLSQVSFDRPMIKQWGFKGGVHGYLNNFLPWLETDTQPWAKDISYISSEDLHFLDLDIWAQYTNCFIITGHSEYWSDTMYNNIMLFRKKGGNVAVFGANVSYYKTGVGGRVMSLPDTRDADDTNAGRKEIALWGDDTNRLVGQNISVQVAAPSSDYVRREGWDNHWAFKDLTNVKSFGGPSDRNSAGLTADGPGYECDACELDGTGNPTFTDGTPRSFIVLAEANLPQGIFFNPRPHKAIMGAFQEPGEGLVFCAGAINWLRHVEWTTVSTITKNVIMTFV